MNLTENTQPALLVSSAAALKALEPAGLKPVAVAGHSLGEYSAVYAAGGVSFRDAVALVQKRGRYMSEAVPPGTGLVAALLGLSADVVKAVCQEAASVGVVAAANFNSPGQEMCIRDSSISARATASLSMAGSSSDAGRPKTDRNAANMKSWPKA